MVIERSLNLLLCGLSVVILFACSPPKPTKNLNNNTPFSSIKITDWSRSDTRTDWKTLKAKGKLNIINETPDIAVVKKTTGDQIEMIYLPKSTNLFGTPIQNIDPTITKIGLFSKDMISEIGEAEFHTRSDFNKNGIPEDVYVGAYEDVDLNIGNIVLIVEKNQSQNSLRLFKGKTGSSDNFLCLLPAGGYDYIQLFYCSPCDYGFMLAWTGKQYERRWDEY